MMRFKSGNHEGETTEEVLLKYPNFAQWTIERYPESPRGQAFIRLILLSQGTESQGHG